MNILWTIFCMFRSWLIIMASKELQVAAPMLLYVHRYLVAMGAYVYFIISFVSSTQVMIHFVGGKLLVITNNYVSLLAYSKGLTCEPAI